MADFTAEQIETALQSKAEHLDPEDIRRVANNRDAVLKMIDDFPADWEKARRQARLLFELIEASATGKIHVHPDELRSAAGALIYLGAAVDIVPDHEKGGYADDAAVVALAMRKSESQLRELCKTRGIDLDELLD